MRDPAGVARRVLLVAVLCRVEAIAGASCSDSGDRSDLVSFCFPSFKGVDNGDSRFDLSWDAGIVDGALHLTTVRRLHHGRIILRPSILLSVEPSYGYRLPSQQHASFNTTFTMSVISWSRNEAAAAIDDGGGLVFEIVPAFDDFDGRTRSNYGGPTYESLVSITSGNISVELGKDNNFYPSGMYVSITPAPTRDAPPANYTVWIDYDGKTQIIWVYVDKGNKPKPAEATLRALNISGIFRWGSYGSYFGLFASKGACLPANR